MQIGIDIRESGVSEKVIAQAKYNQATFWALFVLGQQILSQVCSLIVLSSQSSLIFGEG